VKTVVINHKRYTVQRVFNMVLNYEFTDKHGAIHLVDGEDILEFTGNTNTIDDAIAYAKHYASEVEDGTFWWKVK
jgi:hypothetical protein